VADGAGPPPLAPPPPPAPPPVLFLHIPAAVDASLVAAIGAAYGEAGCVRLARADPRLAATIAGLDEADPPPACLLGPVPLHAWDGRLDRVRPFAMLRHPIARVQALFRGLRADPPERLAHLGLTPDFSIADFIGARSRALAEHVGDGMCRLLCGDPAMTTPGGPGFDDPAARPALLDGALRTLRRMAFGLAEDLPGSLVLLQRAWGIPYALAAAPSPEPAGGEECDPHAVARIVERNMLDIALYEAARALFRARLAAPPPLDFHADPRAVFTPPAGRWIDLPAIAGRQGFHPFEAHGAAWLDARSTARLHFRAPPQARRLSLHLLCVGPAYPVARIGLWLDGRALAFAVTQQEGRRATLKSEEVVFGAAPHELVIAPPYAVPVRALIPDSPDSRQLSLGLAKVLFGA